VTDSGVHPSFSLSCYCYAAATTTVVMMIMKIKMIMMVALLLLLLLLPVVLQCSLVSSLLRPHTMVLFACRRTQTNTTATQKPINNSKRCDNCDTHDYSKHVQ
jgi:hypothetical protein